MFLEYIVFSRHLSNRILIVYLFRYSSLPVISYIFILFLQALTIIYSLFLAEMLASQQSASQYKGRVGSMLFFNVDDGFLEAEVRGYRSGILKNSDYANFAQCETLDGKN